MKNHGYWTVFLANFIETCKQRFHHLPSRPQTMRYRTALAITMTIILLGSLIPFSNHQVLDESKEISFADSEPVMLALAGSSTGHVNSSFIEPAYDGWVISGDTRNNMQFGSINLAATSAQNGGNDADAYVAKVDHNGNWQWAVMPDASAGLVFLQAMTTDPVGNIYIGGLVWGQVNFGTNMVTTPNSAGDGFVAKLDPQGNWVWAQMFNTIPESNGSSRINGLAIDPLTGDVIASGSQSGETTFGSTVLNNTDTEYLLVNLDSFLGDFNWVSSAGGLGTDIGYDVGVDSNGNIWQVGVTSGTFSANGNSHQIISQQDSVLVKWTVSSGVAQVSSVKGLASGAGEINIADDLIVSSSGDIFITGVFIGTLDAGNQKTVTASGTNNADGFVVKIGSNGATSWIKSLGSTSGFDWATSVSESPSGEFAIGGFFSGTVTFGTQSISSNGGRDGFVAQIDDMGSWDWAENIGGAYDDLFGGVTTNMDGNYSATGSFQDTITKGSKSITSTAGWDLYVWTIDPSQNADKDNDGVNDLVDNCPNTNNPLQYDSDLDGDGVGDNSDDCNNTAAGVTVDDLGCAISIPDTNITAIAIGIIDSSTGNQIVLVVEPTDTVASVKAKIQVELGISPDEQTLMFGTNELDDDDVLADKNIVANSMLYLVMNVEDTAPTCYVFYWLGSAGTPQNNWNWTEMMSGWNEFDAPNNGEFTLALPKGDYFVYFGCWDEQGDEITLAVDGLPEIQEFEADENWVWGWDQFTISDTDVGVQHDMIVTWSSTDFGGNVTIHFKGVETVLDSAVESDTGGLPGFPASLALVSLLGAAVILSRRENDQMQ